MARLTTLIGIAAAAILAGVVTARAQELGADPALATAMDGGYFISSVVGGRECRFRLSAERDQGEFRLVMPFVCRTAFPVLKPSVSWTLDKDGNLLLLDAKNATVATFVVAGTNYLEMRDDKGVAINQLTPEAPNWSMRRQQVLGQPEEPPAQAAAKAEQPAAAPEASQPAPVITTPKEMEGWYEIIRANGRKSGCRVAFLAADSTFKGAKAAALDDRCADKGMQIFSPVAWRMEGDSLILTAKRGHELAMARTAQGGWTKARRSGEELVLEKF